MAKLTAIVLGAGAGGGVPQWNCRCAVCALARSDPARVKPRTQASLAVSADGQEWVLLNAAPDLRAQIAATPRLQPRSGLRDSPIAAVILTGAEIDQIAGLLNLRERQAFTIFATEATLAALSENPMFDALSHELVRRQMVKLGEAFEPTRGLAAELYAVSGKTPLYFEGKDRKASEGVNVGVDLRAGDKRIAFVPGAADARSDLTDRLKHASVIFFDGTLFKDDEMITTGAGTKTGRRMGHMPIDGSDGSLRALAELPGRKIYIHLNNTNPALIEGSPERKMIEQAGWAIAEDGLEIVL